MRRHIVFLFMGLTVVSSVPAEDSAPLSTSAAIAPAADALVSGHLSGTVTNSAGSPLEGIGVQVFAVYPDQDLRWVAGDWTAANGVYDIGGLEAGNHVVCFSDYNDVYVSECYNDVRSESDATEIAITVGVTTSGVDAVLALAGHIAGRVTDTAGDALAGIEAVAYSGTDDGGWSEISQAQTAADGSYTIGNLAAGRYIVCFWGASADLYARSCYADAATFRNATPIAVTAGLTTRGIHAVLSDYQLLPDGIGTYSPSDSRFYLDTDGSGDWGGSDWQSGLIGGADFRPLVGDWNGDGFDELGVYLDYQGYALFLFDSNGSGTWNEASDSFAVFGMASNVEPVIGDWNGDGIDAIGVYQVDTGYWLQDVNGDGAWTAIPDRVLAFGCPDCLPVVGDWNGDGIDDIGLRLDYSGYSVFLLDVNGNGVWEDRADQIIVFGYTNGFEPVIGDWNADGADDIGLYHSAWGAFLLDSNGNGVWDDGIDTIAPFGRSGDWPISGRWAN